MSLRVEIEITANTGSWKYGIVRNQKVFKVRGLYLLHLRMVLGYLMLFIDIVVQESARDCVGN